jgi:hypothetical protein
MKAGAVLLVFSTLTAVIYAVLFRTLYPSVVLDGDIISLCALAGIATCLIIAGIWKLATR